MWGNVWLEFWDGICPIFLALETQPYSNSPISEKPRTELNVTLVEKVEFWKFFSFSFGDYFLDEAACNSADCFLFLGNFWPFYDTLLSKSKSSFNASSNSVILWSFVRWSSNSEIFIFPLKSELLEKEFSKALWWDLSVFVSELMSEMKKLFDKLTVFPLRLFNPILWVLTLF